MANTCNKGKRGKSASKAAWSKPQGNLTDLGAVANVNRRRRVGQVDENISHGAAQPQKKRKITKSKTKKQEKAAPTVATADPQSFTFSEDDHDVEVDLGIQGNDSFAVSEPDSDEECMQASQHEPQNEQADSSDGEISDNSECREASDTNHLRSRSCNRSRSRDKSPQRGCSKGWKSSHHNDSVPSRPGTSGSKGIWDTAARIKEIDHQVVEKLGEFEHLMVRGGLVDAAHKLQSSFGMTSQGDNQERHCRSTTPDSAGTEVILSNVNNNKNVGMDSINSQSEETIYKRAVWSVRDSSSTDEGPADTSDECPNTSDDLVDQLINTSIVDRRRERLVSYDRGGRDDYTPVKDCRSRGSHHYSRENSRERSRTCECSGTRDRTPLPPTPQQRAEAMIREAETAKMQILTTSGKIDLSRDFVHSVMVDESFSVVAGHVDETTYGKIIKGQYVDFSKLIPKDKLHYDEEEVLQLVRRNGLTFYQPVKEGTSVTNFNRWEQAFRVFSNIYTQEFPHRSTQLIQYNHIIHDIAQTYIWSNVYVYDMDFHIHMAKNPQKSWGIILQQSWSMRLKERITGGEVFQHRFSTGSTPGGSGGHGRSKVNEPCRRYNRGKCTYGANCKFDHKCTYCYKFGHYVLNCCRAAVDRNDRNKDKTHTHNEGAASGSNTSFNKDRDIVSRK